MLDLCFLTTTNRELMSIFLYVYKINKKNNNIEHITYVKILGRDGDLMYILTVVKVMAGLEIFSIYHNTVSSPVTKV